MIVEESLTDEERSTLRTAAYGAVLLVSDAEPGLLSMVAESFAASTAFAGSRGLVRRVLTDGPVPALRRRSPDEIELVVLPALRRAVEILRAKAPRELDGYRAAVISAGDEVARCVAGTSEAEAAMLGKIRAALGVPA